MASRIFQLNNHAGNPNGCVSEKMSIIAEKSDDDYILLHSSIDSPVRKLLKAES